MEKYEIVKWLENFKKRLKDISEVIKVEQLKKEIEDNEKVMASENFWEDVNAATKFLQRNNELKEKLTKFQTLSKDLEDLETIVELNDESLFDEAESLIKNLNSELEKFEIALLLDEEYDHLNAIMELHPGAGGTESQDWALMLYRMYKRYAERNNFDFELLDYQEASDAGIKSVTFAVKGPNAYGILKGEKGVHRLVRISPFDSGGRRHTSFASVEVLPEITDDIEIEINSDDLRIDTYRASGAGGQHINKTSSAVRITHIPTNIVVSCQSERSQIQNRETAMKMLKSKLLTLKEKENKDKIEELKGNQMDIAWGSQIRSYVFCPYTMVKDHRTSYETSNVTKVLDGDLTPFMEAYLKGAKNESQGNC